MNDDPVQYETYQYPDELPDVYPVEYQPADWYPMSVYRPMFWAALIAGIADVAGVIILGSHAISVAKKAFKKDGEEKP